MRETVSGGITEGTGERMEEEKEGIGFLPTWGPLPHFSRGCARVEMRMVWPQDSHSSDGDDGDDDDDDTKQLQ